MALVKMVMAAVTGAAPQMGDNAKVDLRGEIAVRPRGSLCGNGRALKA
ncbi:hypothetical protein [Caulobacter sp.]|nr:hypothetical protein [Caulobacter sp.]MBO9545809.1 hypothetical protein [Caulobacter sp.]